MAIMNISKINLIFLYHKNVINKRIKNYVIYSVVIIIIC